MSEKDAIIQALKSHAHAIGTKSEKHKALMTALTVQPFADDSASAKAWSALRQAPALLEDLPAIVRQPCEAGLLLANLPDGSLPTPCDDLFRRFTAARSKALSPPADAAGGGRRRRCEAHQDCAAQEVRRRRVQPLEHTHSRALRPPRVRLRCKLWRLAHHHEVELTLTQEVVARGREAAVREVGQQHPGLARLFGDGWQALQ